MSALEDLSKLVGSRRLARDLIETDFDTDTIPWWETPRPGVLAATLLVAAATTADPERERVIPRTNSDKAGGF